MATQMPLNMQWSMQDGATPHTANKVLDFLHNTSGPRVISQRYPDSHNCGHFWSPLSPDLYPCDFILWGFVKEKAFLTRSANLMDWRATIIQLCGEITWDLCRNVITNIGVRLQEVIRQNGGHTEQVYN
jgi:hypothetical protein